MNTSATGRSPRATAERELINWLENYLRRPASYAESSDSLTSRHREILQLIAEGNTTKKIAAILNLSAKTVETHRTQLMERLDIHEVAGLVRYAIRHHLVDSEC